MSGRVKGQGLELRMREAMGRTPSEGLGDIDWLAVAIGNMGGIARAAERLNLEPATIYKWLNSGLSTVEFANVVRLSEGGDVPLEYLARRLQGFALPPEYQTRDSE